MFDKKALISLIIVIILVLVPMYTEKVFALQPAPPGIRITLSPIESVVGEGCPAVLTITVKERMYFGLVNLTIINLPEDVTASISPNNIINLSLQSRSVDSILTVRISPDIPQGDLTLTLKATPHLNDNYEHVNGDFYTPIPVPLYVVPCDRLQNIIISTTTTEIKTIAIREVHHYTTLSITVTSTLNLNPETDMITDSSLYIWAIGATATTIVLAANLILKKKKR